MTKSSGLIPAVAEIEPYENPLSVHPNGVLLGEGRHPEGARLHKKLFS